MYNFLCVLLSVLGFFVIMGVVDSVVYDISFIILYSFVGFLSMIAGAVLYEGD
jgi:cellulose synthase/poly-beta-1,6-N-acetylglucosamine synthase-like glycosyltransferase